MGIYVWFYFIGELWVKSQKEKEKWLKGLKKANGGIFPNMSNLCCKLRVLFVEKEKKEKNYIIIFLEIRF